MSKKSVFLSKSNRTFHLAGKSSALVGALAGRSLRIPYKKTIVGITMPLMAAGCTALQYYEGEPRAPSEIARVFVVGQTTPGAEIQLTLHSINESIPDYVISGKVLEVLPGKHQLVARFSIATGRITAIGEGPHAVATRLPSGGYAVTGPTVIGHTYDDYDSVLSTFLKPGYTYVLVQEEQTGPISGRIICLTEELHDAAGAVESKASLLFGLKRVPSQNAKRSVCAAAIKIN